jgi:rhodanese-related sulfurtransferase
MNPKLQNNIFFKLNEVMDRLDELERRMNRLEKESSDEFEIQKCQIMRLKNGDFVSDDYILNGRSYNDLSPEMAWDLYNERDLDFILLDVSQKSFHPLEELPEAINIPLEELNLRVRELVNKATRIFVISENGTRSILACEMLNKHGYFNVNNISGGYKFWPGFKELRHKRGDNSEQDNQEAA